MKPLVLLFALALAAGAVKAGDAEPSPLDPKAKAPAAHFRSAFEGYRAYAEPQPADWRKANEDVGAAGGHPGHRPGQGAGRPASKPEPDRTEGGHGGHAK